jgi:dTDP-4-amino-4,6-dideoxygalactose transaminase
MTRRVPLRRDRLSDNEITAMLDCLRSGWLTMGPRTARLEAEAAGWLGCSHAVAVSTGTAALLLACRAASLGSGDEVLVSAIARPAVAQAVRACGADVRHIDIRTSMEPVLDAADVVPALTRRTRALIVSHPWGYATAVDELRAACDERGVVLIEDASEAFGACLPGSLRRAGTVGHIGCFSLAWGRQLGIGQGGLLVSHDERLAGRARLLRSHGLSSTTWDRHRGHADAYDVIDVGFNFRIDEPRAALATARLSGLPGRIDRLRVAEGRYRGRIDAQTDLHACFSRTTAQSAAPLAFAFLCRDARHRSMLAARLQGNGVEPGGPGGTTRTLPARAAEFALRSLTLPLHAWSEGSEQDRVLDLLGAAA